MSEASTVSWELLDNAVVSNTWDEAALGPRPSSWAGVEHLAATASERLKFSVRTLAAGLHELQAIQRLGPDCKSVCPVLGALRICEVPTPASDNPRSSNGSDRSKLPPALGQLHRTSAPAGVPDPTGFSPSSPCSSARRMTTGMRGSESWTDMSSELAEWIQEREQSAESATPGVREQAMSAQQPPPTTGPAPLPGHAKATHLLLIQPLGTPLYGSELTVPDLTWQIYKALRELHKTLVHGDVNRGNIMWDPTGYFFQFIDFELATWRSGEASRVVSPHMAFPAMSRAAHGSTPTTRVIVHGTLEYCGINQLKGKWPTCADDLISMYWSTVAAFCPRSLWWGGLPLQELEYDERNSIESRLLLTEEANLLAYAQVLYLSSDQGSVSLERSHDLQQPDNKQPVRFEATLEAPFVPASSSPLSRWKHYVARAFAQTHVLRLTLSAGTADEPAAINEFHGELRELLHKMGDFDMASSRAQLETEFPMDAGFLAALEECARASEDPMPYSFYLDQLENIGPPSTAARASDADASAPPPLSFQGVTELVTSEGTRIWGPREQRAHGTSVLFATPWQFTPRRSYEECAKALRACCQSASMGFEPVDNPWDCAVAALQEQRLREHKKLASRSWKNGFWRSHLWRLLPIAAVVTAVFALSAIRSWHSKKSR